MSSRPAAPVFFDVDGVLLDSLPQHLAMCADAASEFGLNLKIPSVEQFRAMVAAGVKVSPMLDFFVAVGFPMADARRAVEIYDREFAQRYPSRRFDGIKETLDRLHLAGHPLGLVTANIAANVEPALEDVLGLFDPRCLFYFDRFRPARAKSWCLNEAARILGARSSDCVFVGDQPADAAAAEAANWRFLGVSYGWGFVRGDPSRRLVHSATEIAIAILG